MRIAVIGAGAVGSILGALLSRENYEVTLVGRAPHVTAIQEKGLQVDGCLGAFVAQVEAVESLAFRPDLALLAVKTQDVIAAIQSQRAFLTDVPLVTLQNGIRSDEFVATLLPREQLLSGVVQLHATYLSPGQVTLVYQGGLIVGRAFGPRDQEVEDVAHLLNQVVPTRVTDNIHGAHWLKLLINLNNALPAVTNLEMRQVYADPYLLRLAVSLMREGIQVADRANIQLESLYDVSSGLVRLMRWLPMPLATRLTAAKLRQMQTPWPLLGSTLQSLRRGKQTEIEFLNGEIVRTGAHLGIPTPLNAKIVELTHEVEQSGKFFTPDEIRLAYQNDAVYEVAQPHAQGHA
jgi:2-dehydropantoate 2-reductase